MAEIINLAEHWDGPDIASMGREELREYLRELRDRLEVLDDREPERMDSPAYDDWAERHEQLEDLVDDVLDLLDCT